ncbi:hypothetical protein SLA2020_278820 [Shorea laevis]
MRAFCAISSAEQLSFLSKGIFSTARTQLSFPAKLFSCQAKFTDSGTDGSFNLKVVPPALLAAEKEEAKAVLTLFLKKQGLSNAVASRTINKSDLFIDHLVSRLHSIHKSRYLVGRELTTLEIRDALNPYLEALLEEHGNVMLKAISRVSEIDPAGKLRPHVLYLIELGMDLEQIKGITQRFPSFAYYSLEGKIKPVVEFLLDLGVPKSDIPPSSSKGLNCVELVSLKILYPPWPS